MRKKNAVKREHNLPYFLVFTLKDQVTMYHFFISGNSYPTKVVVTLHKVCSGLCHSRQTGRSGGTEWATIIPSENLMVSGHVHIWYTTAEVS